MKIAGIVIAAGLAVVIIGAMFWALAVWIGWVRANDPRAAGRSPGHRGENRFYAVWIGAFFALGMLIVAGPFLVLQWVYETSDERAWWQSIITMSAAGLAVLIMWLGGQRVRRTRERGKSQPDSSPNSHGND